MLTMYRLPTHLQVARAFRDVLKKKGLAAGYMTDIDQQAKLGIIIL